MKVVLSDKAKRDLLRIYAYLARQSPCAAEVVMERIDEKFVNLSNFPFIGRPRSSFGSGIRSLVSGMYVIFYFVDGGQITVVRVIHGQMDIDEEFKR